MIKKDKSFKCNSILVKFFLAAIFIVGCFSFSIVKNNTIEEDNTNLYEYGIVKNSKDNIENLFKNLKD